MSLLSDISRTIQSRRRQAAQDQIAGRQFNLDMDKESRNFYGNKANDAYFLVFQDYKDLFDANEKSTFADQNAGTQNFSISDLYRIGAKKFDVQNKGRVAAPGEKENFVEGYVTRYFNDTGFASAMAGPNKIAGRLNFDPETNQISPDLLTYDPERQQVYRAPMTLNGGQKVSEGGQPMSIPTSAADEQLRMYMNNIRSSAGFDTKSTGLASLYTPNVEQPGELNPGGPGSFDPSTIVERRRSLETQYGPPQSSSPAMTTEDTTVSETTTTTAPSSTGTSTVTSTNTDGAFNIRANRPYDTTELNNMIKGGASGYNRAMDVLDPFNEFVFEPDKIPLLSAEQFAGYSEQQQSKFIKAAQERSDKNISQGFTQGLERQGVSDLNFVDSPGLRAPAEPGMSGGQQLLPAKSAAAQLAEWEEKHGEVIPLDSVQDDDLVQAKLATLRGISQFYNMRVEDKGLTDLFKKHPVYFRQFQELGAVEFARRYMNDPEFAKNLPSKQKTAQTKVQVNRIEKELQTNLGVSFARVPVGETSQKETTFKEQLDFPKPPGTAIENSVAALLNDRADANIDEADLTDLNRRQRFVVGYTILGSLPETMRTQMRPNVDSLIEYGVLKTRLDRTPKPTEVADDLNQAYQTDTTRRGQDATMFGNVLTSEANQRRADQTDTSQMITQRGQDITLANSLRTARTALLNRQDNATAETRKKYRDTLGRLERANPKEDDEGTMDVFTEGRAYTGGQLRDHIRKPEFSQGLNILAQEINTAFSAEEALILQPFVDNAIYNIVGGATNNDFKLFSIPSWGREMANWWRGDVEQGAFNLSSRVIAIGEDNRPIYDMSLVYHPTRNAGGVKVKAFRAIGPDGRTQQGVDFAPSGVIGAQGSNFYNLILSHAITTANQLGMGGG